MSRSQEEARANKLQLNLTVFYVAQGAGLPAPTTIAQAQTQTTAHYSSAVQQQSTKYGTPGKFQKYFLGNSAV